MNTGGVISADLSAASRALLVPGSSSDIRLIPLSSQKGFLSTSWTLEEGCEKGIEHEKHSCGSGFLQEHPSHCGFSVAAFMKGWKQKTLEWRDQQLEQDSKALNFNPSSIESYYHKRLARAGPIPTTASSGLLWVVRQASKTREHTDPGASGTEVRSSTQTNRFDNIRTLEAGEETHNFTVLIPNHFSSASNHKKTDRSLFFLSGLKIHLLNFF